MKQLSLEVIKKAVLSKGYKWFDDKLNIVGVRTADLKSNTFNDFITVSWKDKKTGEWKFTGFEATTDPGLYWLKNPMNVKGTAIMVPGQYVDCWQKGTHSGYPALIQIGGAIKVYRDNNRDEYLDMDPKSIQSGYFGVNIHRANFSVLSLLVEKYSAGCQVIRRGSTWTSFWQMVCDSMQSSFSYTLLTENDL